MTLDEQSGRRLTELRAHDRRGYFASDRSATGADESESIAVTVDPTNRVTAVAVTRLDERLRSPAGLADAVRQAATAARVERIENGRPPHERAARRPRPVARRPRLPVQAPAPPPHLGDAGAGPPLPDFAAARQASLSAITPATGVSGNECALVTLDAGSADGTLSADPGWLANATAGQIGSAVTQAYEDAYRKRDRS